MSNITDKAMLVSLNISQWSARRQDKRVTKEVAEKHGNLERLGRYNKSLIDPEAESFKAIGKIANEARTTHYEMTLPWAQDGARILPRKAYFEYTQKMDGLMAQFKEAVRDFAGDYPRLKSNARVQLNGLFNPADYPNDNDIARRFGFSVDILPVPSGQDFRVDLGDADVKAIRERIEQSVRAAQEEAMRDLWRRLHETTSYMAERLSQPDAIFRDSLVGNVRDLVDLLPSLNMTDDIELENARQEVARKLSKLDPDTLRSDPAARARAARAAADIASKMAGFV